MKIEHLLSNIPKVNTNKHTHAILQINLQIKGDKITELAEVILLFSLKFSRS